MSKTKQISALLVMALIVLFNKVSAQEQDPDFPIDPLYHKVFDPDSLKGFDESAARASAISEGNYGSEFIVKMYNLKKEYINNKYGLVKPQTRTLTDYLIATRPAAAPGCNNEDFEASTPGQITSSNQIAGWTITKGYNSSNLPTAGAHQTVTPYYPGGIPSPANSCNMAVSCCPIPPHHSMLVDCSAPGGFVDNQIGAQYPIYSVFGSGTPNTAAAAANPQLTGSMFGTKVLRLNDGVTGDYSIERLSKTFAVTPSNALFQFAFISVFATAHSCCDAGAFVIQLTNATANTVIPCPNFSVSAPSSQCIGGPGTPGYRVAGTGALYTGSGGGIIYNPWQINSMDLTAYIGQNITIDIIVSDCAQGAHYGKIYFDAQCGPMVVRGNDVPYDAGLDVTVPTCGAAGATICAVDGLGPYSWAGPNVPAGYTVPSMTNQCLVTNISAQYTLYMQPAGACVPIARIVNSTITPAPLLNASVQQAVCGSTLAVVSITPSGSAANPSTLSWSPTPVSINSGTTIASYAIPSGQAPMVVSITGTDPLGCLVTTTVNVNPAPPIPTFSIVNTSKSYSVTCFNPTVTLDATTSYSYNNGTLNYLWASASQTFVANSASIVTPGSYTVTATDPVTQCSTVQVVVVGVNTVAPLSTISPSFQSISCTVPANQVTLVANPAVNVTHMIISPFGGTFTANSHSVAYLPVLGTSTYCLRNDVNGCETCKEFTVTSNQSFPTFKLTSPQNFSVGCNTTSCAVISIDNGQGGGGGAVTYTVLPPGASTVTPSGLLSPISTYTVCAPGAYTVITKDNVSLCETRVPVSILQNTFAPNLSAIVPRTILNCDNPSVQLKGLSNTENVEYSWIFVGTPNTVQADTVTAHIGGTPTKTLLNTYTLVINDLSSTCKSYSVIPIYQSIYPPRAAVSPVTSSLTCLVPTVMLTNQSTETTPPSTGLSYTLPVIGFWWEGPTPQEPLSNSTSYVAGTPGVYTMTAKDTNNGCLATTTVTVVDFRTPPIVNDPPPLPSVLDCGDRFVNLVPTITNPSPGYTYSWTAPATSTVGNATAQTFMAGATGEYNLRVYNPANGCATEVSMEVIDGALTTTFTPDQTEGFAPLAVNFTNGSSSTSGNSGVYSVWNFGNQTSVTYSTVQSASVVFNQPGTYTVTLHTAKGSCMGTAQRVIRVESPSSLEVPNVFTPNGDGANDLFFVKAKNLVEIQAVIFDRWGNVVYEVNSLTGNIEWDGKNSQGRVVAEGTYFYTIKAVGKDNTSYEKKGTVSLIR